MLSIELYGWLLLIIVGTATGAVISIIILVDYPPPERLTAKLWGLYVAGAVGGLIGAALFGQPILQNDPTSGRQLISVIGVVATAALIVGATAIASGLHRKQQVGR